MSDRMLNINTTTADELKQIPCVGDKTAQLIIQFREIYGVVKKEALILALSDNLPSDILDHITFLNQGGLHQVRCLIVSLLDLCHLSYSNQLGKNINCLPAVP